MFNFFLFEMFTSNTRNIMETKTKKLVNETKDFKYLVEKVENKIFESENHPHAHTDEEFLNILMLIFLIMSF